MLSLLRNCALLTWLSLHELTAGSPIQSDNELYDLAFFYSARVASLVVHTRSCACLQATCASPLDPNIGLNFTVPSSDPGKVDIVLAYRWAGSAEAYDNSAYRLDSVEHNVVWFEDDVTMISHVRLQDARSLSLFSMLLSAVQHSMREIFEGFWLHCGEHVEAYPGACINLGVPVTDEQCTLDLNLVKMSLFGSKKKLAHTPKLGAILQTGSLKPLGELINSEKIVMASTDRLALDMKRSSEAIREWAATQGDDLNDVLSKVSVLYDILASSHSRFSEHDSTYRIHYKSLRKREEDFIALRKNRDSLAGKISSAENKLGRMSSENKDLPAATQRLQELKQEMVGLEHAVNNEDARLYDYRRDTTREAMSLKLGAMLELAEKMTVIAEMSKLLIAEIPRDRSLVGSTRPYYEGFPETERVMQEAQTCLQTVVFNPIAGQGLPSGAAAEMSYDEDGLRLVDPNQSRQSNTDTADSRYLADYYNEQSDSNRLGAGVPATGSQRASAERERTSTEHSHRQQYDSALPSPSGQPATLPEETEDPRSSLAYMANKRDSADQRGNGYPMPAMPSADPPQNRQAQQAAGSRGSYTPPPPPGPERPGQKRGDSLLGSKHGFDQDPYQPTSGSRPPREAQVPQSSNGPAEPSGYSYGRPGEYHPVPRGAGHRPAAPGGRYAQPHQPYVPGQPSPADLYRDQWRATSYHDVRSEEGSDAVPALRINKRDTADVPRDESGEFAHIRQSSNEAAMRKQSLTGGARLPDSIPPAYGQAARDSPIPSEQGILSGGTGFASNRYVTRLD
ncbi:uncharacterized protein L969DRAFT_94964 [Mixia osmundae IAM 14324]|uniref:Uncharacterized protein n=1 Tax=Mixia osmundae (strain CBS 9802 / IAM 14324 / JCM 22182 / KY 12970) TaxID=764103 RepID=G7E165_MIXOS|nr:uncharacterized protein L969DRAFT_94964 [Mixia osmundae IAM 14324]KEI38787.1 hypothetical protein L969DRAFT_94964 [Mixia osmundae IAM 14324]GAA96575.1 hypothetical protein E5Q_03244 [Mixia osmundae IAM 14324]